MMMILRLDASNHYNMAPMAMDELHFTREGLSAAHGSLNDAAAGKTPTIEDNIDFPEQFDWRGEADGVHRHIDKQFVQPAELGDEV